MCISQIILKIRERKILHFAEYCVLVKYWNGFSWGT